MIYEVVYCSDCKKPIKSVPTWLATVNVRFTCETCRQKHPRGVLGFDSGPGPRVPGDPDLDAEEVIGEPVELSPSADVSLDDPDSEVADPDTDAIAAGVSDD